MRISDPAELWSEYKKAPSLDLRNQLIVHYQPFVRYVAERLVVKLPSFVDVDDLTSMGIFGLYDAIERFNPELGIKFKAYAVARIRGAILDEIRKEDWAPRLIRIKAKKLETARAIAETKLGRAPTFVELAEQLGVSFEELQKECEEGDVVAMISLSEEWTDEGVQSNRKIDLIEDTHPDSNPVVALIRSEEAKLGTLPELALLTTDELLFMRMYYCERLSMKTIAGIVDLTESRVCQIISKGQGVLRRSLRGRGVTAMQVTRR
jgi:RNA polymerase sigma factor for flagellar operon FliA